MAKDIYLQHNHGEISDQRQCPTKFHSVQQKFSHFWNIMPYCQTDPKTISPIMSTIKRTCWQPCQRPCIYCKIMMKEALSKFYYILVINKTFVIRNLLLVCLFNKIMKRKLKQWWSAIPPISTTTTTNNGQQFHQYQQQQTMVNNSTNINNNKKHNYSYTYYLIQSNLKTNHDI